MTRNARRNPMLPNRFRVCQCGCGLKLEKTRAHGAYFNVAHRQKAYRDRMAAAK